MRAQLWLGLIGLFLWGHSTLGETADRKNSDSSSVPTSSKEQHLTVLTEKDLVLLEKGLRSGRFPYVTERIHLVVDRGAEVGISCEPDLEFDSPERTVGNSPSNCWINLNEHHLKKYLSLIKRAKKTGIPQKGPAGIATCNAKECQIRTNK